jgi:hypothetical protein
MGDFMQELTSDFKSIMGNTLPIIILVSVMAIVLRLYFLKKSHKKIHFSIIFRNYGIFSVDAGIFGKKRQRGAEAPR